MAEKKPKQDKIEAEATKVAAKVTAKSRAKADAAAAEKVTEDVKASKKPAKTAAKVSGKTVKEIETPVENTEAADTTESAEEAEAKATAKAGKRSAKSVKEAEEKQAKEERKAKTAEDAEKDEAPKPKQKVRTRLERRGKNYRKAVEGLDLEKDYSLKDALELALKTSKVKFDATVEVHVNLGVDPRHADQNVRDNLVLPAGTGKVVRVAVFAEADDQAKAKKAGADVVGNEEFIAQLEKGEINFDILIATPAQMPKLGKYARVLGPKGLMPNPKSGTVTPDVTKAVTEAKAGRVEYRVDSTGIAHVGVGKVSFGIEKLMQNTQALFVSIKNAKPASLKGTYIQGVHVTTSMGPSFKVLTSEV